MIKKEPYSRCWDCNAEGDDTEHALFNCPNWTNEKIILENYVDDILTTTNTVEVVVSKEEYWKKFQEFCQKVMMERQAQKKDLERRRRVRGRSWLGERCNMKDDQVLPAGGSRVAMVEGAEEEGFIVDKDVSILPSRT